MSDIKSYAAAFGSDRQKQLEFAQRVLPIIMDEAMRAGLPITQRCLHDAVRAAGWELAGNFEKADSYWSHQP